jgi:hypothetical protein
MKTTKKLLNGKAESTRNKKVLRLLLGAAIQAATFGGGC